MPFTQSRNESINLRANVEPSPDLKIQFDVKKETTDTYQEIFRYDDSIGDHASLNPSRGGSYRISFLNIKTTFNKTNDNVESDVFKTFEQNLIVLKDRLKFASGESYDTTSQDVLVPAFIAAYTGKDVNTVGLSAFSKNANAKLEIGLYRIDQDTSLQEYLPVNYHLTRLPINVFCNELF
jgi:cell surface protein SprA